MILFLKQKNRDISLLLNYTKFGLQLISTIHIYRNIAKTHGKLFNRLVC
jgi:hypothetical protein